MSLFDSSPLSIAGTNVVPLITDPIDDLTDEDLIASEDDLLNDLNDDQTMQASTVGDTCGYRHLTDVANARVGQPDVQYMSSLGTGSRELVIQRIDGIMIRLVTQLSKGQLMSFSLKDGEFEAGLEEESELQGRLFAFPGTGPEESWRFTVMVKILGHIHEACVTNTIVSKRDIYYHDPSLFGSQATVDRHIDQIAAELHVRRSDLNVTAAAKGLITGAATMDYQNGSMDDLSLCSDIKLIASCERLMTVSLSSAKFILVVEKEASFQDLVTTATWQHVKHHAIAVTGKGYPDIATRRLLHLLAHPTAFNHFADPPVYLLTDFDPDGIAIANVYKHGSLNLTHEGDGIKTTKAQRLGLTREHVQEDDSMMGSHVLLPMTMRDRRKARTMLVRMVGSSEMTDDTSDLQCMLMTNLKAELQTLDEGHGGLNKLLASLIPG